MSSRIPPMPKIHSGRMSFSSGVCRVLTRLNSSMQSSLALLAFMICVSLQFPACEAADDWKPFSPEVGIDMSMPGEVKTVRKDGKETGAIESYQSEDGNYVYIITSESASDSTDVDDVIKELKDLISKDGFENYSAPQNTFGKNWAGKKFTASTKTGEATLAIQMAIDNDHNELVSQTTSAPIDSAEAKKFFGSLRIDPVAIKAERAKNAEKFLQALFHPTTPLGWGGLALTGLGGLAWGLGWLCMVIVAFRTSILWGLAIFIPGGVGALIFLCFNFQKAIAPFLLQIFGIVLLGVGMATTLPSAIANK